MFNRIKQADNKLIIPERQLPVFPIIPHLTPYHLQTACVGEWRSPAMERCKVPGEITSADVGARHAACVFG